VAKCFTGWEMTEWIHVEARDTDLIQLECISEQRNREFGDIFLDSILRHLQKLNGSTVTFFGDSVMKQQWAAMSCMLNSSADWTANYKDDNILTTNVVNFSNGCSVTLRFRRVGFHYSNLDKYEEYLKSEIRLTAGPHVILINQGIHHTALRNIVNNTMAIIATEEKHAHTQFIWRETTPQNHPTSNGWWAEECYLSCRCVTLTPEMLNG